MKYPYPPSQKSLRVVGRYYTSIRTGKKVLWNGRRLLSYDAVYGDEHYNRNEEHIKEQRIARRYGVTRGAYYAMFKAQQYRCALCPVAVRPLTKKSHVDHDHETNLVRGILCERCNLLLGKYEKVLRYNWHVRARAYISRGGGVFRKEGEEQDEETSDEDGPAL